MASKCISPTSLDAGFQVHLQTPSITASKCISRLARLQSVSLHDHGLQVHLQIGSITTSKFAQSWLSSTSPHSLDYGFQVRTMMASKSSPYSCNQNLGVNLKVHSITASKCLSEILPITASTSIPNLALSWHRSVTLSSLDRHF